MRGNYACGAALFDGWRGDVVSGKPPVTFPVAPPDHPLAKFEIGPGIVGMIGAPPAGGKTALMNQMVFDAVALTPSLRAVIANVEMSPAAFLDRQLSRLSGIPLRLIRKRLLTVKHADQLATGLAAVRARVERVAFVRPPFDLANVAATAAATGADLILLDYVQRIGPPKGYTDKRLSLNAVMDAVRGFADAGCGVLVVSAVGRQKDASGKSSYDGLNLASFRESSELEYGSDSAYLLDRQAGSADAVLRCVKDRHGDPCDIPLTFDGAHQRFDAGFVTAGQVSAAVRELWGGQPEGGDW